MATNNAPAAPAAAAGPAAQTNNPNRIVFPSGFAVSGDRTREEVAYHPNTYPGPDVPLLREVHSAGHSESFLHYVDGPVDYAWAKAAEDMIALVDPPSFVNRHLVMAIIYTSPPTHDWPSGSRGGRNIGPRVNAIANWAQGHATWSAAMAANGDCPELPLTVDEAWALKVMGTGEDMERNQYWEHVGTLSAMRRGHFARARLAFILDNGSPIIDPFWANSGVYDPTMFM